MKGLVDDQGTRHEDPNTLCAMVKDYFTGLFTKEVQVVDSSVLHDVKCNVTDGMNKYFLALFSAQEVRKALFSIGDLKDPGPDGLHAVLYKRF